jgi:hypothetical protein
MSLRIGGHSSLPTKARFHRELLVQAKCRKEEFNNYRNFVLDYRNDFIAHLLDQRTMHTPKLDIMLTTVIFYFKYLIQFEGDAAIYQPDLLGNIEDELADREAEAAAFYRREF